MEYDISEIPENLVKYHYLSIALSEMPFYYEGFLQSINNIKSFLSNKQFTDLMKNKLFLTRKKEFIEEQYIQAACELTVNSYFANKYPKSFQYEYKVNKNSNKDVDLFFQDKIYKYNIEVKCPSFNDKKSYKKEGSIEVITPIRSKNKYMLYDTIETLKKQVKYNTCGQNMLIHQKNMDNNLKDFLISAHKKFDSNIIANSLNILVVCCDDDLDIQNWYNYLFSNQGLFTQNSFTKPEEYSNVDIIVLTSLFHNHFKFHRKGSLENHWKMDKSFNLIYNKPNLPCEKKDAFYHFMEILPNYNKEISEFKRPAKRKKIEFEMLFIHSFSVDYLEPKGILHFDRSYQKII